MPATPTAPVATIADAKEFARDGFTFRPLAVPSRGSVELAIWALEIAPGAASELHSMDREEVFVVVRGQVSATVGGVEVTATDGDAIIVPPGALLQIRNTLSQDPATLVAATSVGMKATVGDATFPPPWSQ